MGELTCFPSDFFAKKWRKSKFLLVIVLVNWQNGKRSIDMKDISLFRYTARVCGLVAALVTVSSCGSPLSPERAARRFDQSPVTSVFSHNSVHTPGHRDCYEVGPLPERTRRALITWLHNSTVKEMSYVYPQYYLTTTNAKGGGEVVWGILSDGQGHMVGVLVPTNKRVPAWDLPTIGSYKVFVCDTKERDALGAAIMEDLSDPARKLGSEVGYDQPRIDALKATGLTDKRYLLSKPLNENEQKQLEQERKEKAKAGEEAKGKAAKKNSEAGDDAAQQEASDDSGSSDDEDSDSSSGDSSDSSSDSSDDSEGGESDSSSDDDSEGETDETEDTDSDSDI